MVEKDLLEIENIGKTAGCLYGNIENLESQAFERANAFKRERNRTGDY